MKDSFKKPNIDFKKFKDFNVKISQVPPLDVAFSTMALSDYELLVATIYRLNELIQVSNSYTELINNILEWVVNDGLEQAVLDNLLAWKEDGTLEDLINDVLFEKKLDKTVFESFVADVYEVFIDDINTDLDLKADKVWVEEQIDLINGGLNDVKDRYEKEYINVLYPGRDLEPLIADGVYDNIDRLWLIMEFARDNKVDIVFPSGVYKTSKFNIFEGVNIYGIGKPRIDLFKSDNEKSTIPLLAFGSNSICDGIYFNSIEDDAEWNRGELANRSNVTIKNCKIEGFRDEKSNSWGLYLDGTENILIENCVFENNKQSDIAIVENCRNITIINAQGSKLSLNIEPNAEGFVENINVIGGNYDVVWLLENRITSKVIKNVNISSHIKELRYRGAAVNLTGSIVDKVIHPFGLYMAGNIIGMPWSLGEELIKDTHINVIDNDATGNNFWYAGYMTTNQMISRNKIGLIINPKQISAVSQINSKKFDVVGGKDYLINMKSLLRTLPGASFIGRNLVFKFYDVTDNEVMSAIVYFNFIGSNSVSRLEDEFVIVKAPLNSKTMNISLLNSNELTTNQLNIEYVSVKEVKYSDTISGSRNNVLDNLLISAKPVQLFSGFENVYLKGKRIKSNNGVVSEYVCIESGNPGVWKEVKYS